MSLKHLTWKHWARYGAFFFCTGAAIEYAFIRVGMYDTVVNKKPLIFDTDKFELKDGKVVVKEGVDLDETTDWIKQLQDEVSIINERKRAAKEERAKKGDLKWWERFF